MGHALMPWISLAVFPGAGMLFNRWRGGGAPYLPGETLVPDHKRSQVRRVVWALVMGVMALNAWVALALFLSCLTGWGFPVSAAQGKNQTPWEPEFGPIDEIAHLLSRGRGAQFYGTVWLTIHGLLFGGIVAALTHSKFGFLLGLMGISYRFTKDSEAGERAFGVVQGVAMALILMDIYG